MCHRRLLHVFLLLLFSFCALAQEVVNPFELPAKGEDEMPQSTENQDQSDNPFDLQDQTTVSSNKNSFNKPQNSSDDLDLGSNQLTKAFRLSIALVLLVSLALIMTLFRGRVNDFFESAYRDRKFNQFFRRMNSMWIIPNLLIYLFFFINVAIFINLAADFWGYVYSYSLLRRILFAAIGIMAFFLFKHSVVYFLGKTFDVENEAMRYSLLILTFNVIMGIALTPINLLIVLGPLGIQKGIILLGFAVIGILILLLILRALSVANRLLWQHSLHFFMYFCTIEIAPLFIVAKMAM